MQTPLRGKKIDLNEVVKLDEVKDGGGCGGCGEEVMDGQCGIECEMCRGWFHIKCEIVTQKDYRKMTEVKEIIWICRICKRSFKEVSERNMKLNDENKKLKEEIRELK